MCEAADISRYLLKPMMTTQWRSVDIRRVVAVLKKKKKKKSSLSNTRRQQLDSTGYTF